MFIRQERRHLPISYRSSPRRSIGFLTTKIPHSFSSCFFNNFKNYPSPIKLFHIKRVIFQNFFIKKKKETLISPDKSNAILFQKIIMNILNYLVSKLEIQMLQYQSLPFKLHDVIPIPN